MRSILGKGRSVQFKIPEAIYKRLLAECAEISQREQRPVSIAELIRSYIEKPKRKRNENAASPD